MLVRLCGRAEPASTSNQRKGTSSFIESLSQRVIEPLLLLRVHSITQSLNDSMILIVTFIISGPAEHTFAPSPAFKTNVVDAHDDRNNRHSDEQQDQV